MSDVAIALRLQIGCLKDELECVTCKNIRDHDSYDVAMLIAFGISYEVDAPIESHLGGYYG